MDADLPARAEDAVAQLKRPRDENAEPSKKRRTEDEDKPSEEPAPEEEKVEENAEATDATFEELKHQEPPVLSTESVPKPECVWTVDNSSVLADVAHFQRRTVGSVLYTPGKMLVDGHELQFNGVLQVRVSGAFLKDNDAVKQRALWGTDVYTDDSDLVAVLHHLNALDAMAEPHDMCVDLLLLPVLEKYHGCYRNGLNSRTWVTRHDGISYMVLGTPRKMPLGWAASVKQMQPERLRALKAMREFDPLSIAYS